MTRYARDFSTDADKQALSVQRSRIFDHLAAVAIMERDRWLTCKEICDSLHKMYGCEFRETSISAELRNFRKSPDKGGMIGGPYLILSRRRKGVRIDEYRYAGKKSKFVESTLFDDLELGKCNTLQEAR